MNDESIPMIPLDAQRRMVFDLANKEAVKQLEVNANAPVIEPFTGFNESLFSADHLLDKHAGFESPHADIVKAYCDQLKQFDTRYTQAEIAREILGINARRLREYIQGKHKVPFELWQRMLVATGRTPQHIIKVVAYCK